MTDRPKETLSETLKRICADPQGQTLRDSITWLVAEIGLDKLLHALRAEDPDGFNAEIEVMGYALQTEMDDDEAECVAEANSLLHAMGEAMAELRGGRRDEARHKLYMALPHEFRDLFHPEDGLKA